MNPIKSILVHADSSPRTVTRIQAAAAIARTQGASVQVLYAVLPIYAQYPYSLSISAEAASLLEEAQDVRSARARTLFDQAVSDAQMPVGWSAATGDPV